MRRLLVVAVVLLVGAPALRADETRIAPVTVPFEVLPSNHMAVRIRINGKGPYRVIFDTGAPVTLLSNKVARASGVVSRTAPAPLFSLFGAMGQVQIKELSLGAVRAADVPAMVMDHPTIELMAKYFGPIEGIVGFPFFARYRTSIDYQKKQLTFTPSDYRPPDPVQSIMASVSALGDDDSGPRVLSAGALWGVVLHKDSGDTDAGVTVQKVMPESPADSAGLRAGDRLLSLDGRWTDSETDALEAAKHVRAGGEARVVVRRGQSEQVLTVRPRAGI
jgi:hypothetical protein